MEGLNGGEERREERRETKGEAFSIIYIMFQASDTVHGGGKERLTDRHITFHTDVSNGVEGHKLHNVQRLKKSGKM